MQVGPFVFGDDRLGVWVINTANLSDKLKHVLPRLRNAAPITDVFLPEEALSPHKDLVRENLFYSHTYAIPKGRTPADFALRACSSHGGKGALELNIELPDEQMKDYVVKTVAEVRKRRPNVPLRINVAPFKGSYLPSTLFWSDANLYLIAQTYFGNMDGRASESDVLMDLIDAGLPLPKCSVMYGAMNGNPTRAPSLPSGIRRLRRGSIYSDDLLMDAGLI